MTEDSFNSFDQASQEMRNQIEIDNTQIISSLKEDEILSEIFSIVMNIAKEKKIDRIINFRDLKINAKGHFFNSVCLVSFKKFFTKCLK